MNKLFLKAGVIMILLFSLLGSSSCTKTETKTITVTDNSVLHLLTEKQWISDSVYSNYTGPNTGTLVYVRGGNNNTQDLTTVRVIFWKDGAQDFFWNGAYSQFQWSFTGTDSANILIKNPSNDYGRILKLNANYLTIYDSTGSGLAVYIYKP
jgi:hypothetical protein